MGMKSGFVAIVGRPNAGKSTLLNSVLKARVSIVTPKAQTTRDRVLGILTEERGQIVFIDTPGIHRAKVGGINEYMVRQAREALEAPSVIWYIVDPRSELPHEMAVIELLADSAKYTKVPVMLLLNKSDLVREQRIRDKTDKLGGEILAAAVEKGIRIDSTFRISAQTGTGLNDLLAATWERLEEGPLYYPDQDQLSDRPTRFFVAEMIREQLFLRLGEELPYSCAVEIERFDEAAKPPRIEAVIHVERESQKGIVVGKGGVKIKEIGQNARRKIEEFLGYTVFLGLKVKLLKDWTRDAAALRRMGYTLPEKRK
ncbi:MAG: GTPase Era [Bdellovibrionales bacterium RIFOXYC1_FULL_54_43]|nr:MAG: GTPase Era [Bdellovibrionales bacterium RIFOXYC1_FULL_54_43]OFZ84307.1 MAG: GTPase Era [Bdellovibrionales bacterium RIFOXYD1_FULL_55_31]